MSNVVDSAVDAEVGSTTPRAVALSVTPGAPVKNPDGKMFYYLRVLGDKDDGNGAEIIDLDEEDLPPFDMKRANQLRDALLERPISPSLARVKRLLEDEQRREPEDRRGSLTPKEFANTDLLVSIAQHRISFSALPPPDDSQRGRVETLIRRGSFGGSDGSIVALIGSPPPPSALKRAKTVNSDLSGLILE